jgi:hypothetical protein
MRKIEKQMLNAISSKVDKWMNNNTSVFYISAMESGNPFGARSEVYLHGNHIADYWHESGSLEVNSRTLAQWSTPTTKSRLRALGANVATRKGITYLNDVAI